MSSARDLCLSVTSEEAPDFSKEAFLLSFIPQKPYGGGQPLLFSILCLCDGASRLSESSRRGGEEV